MVTPKILYAQMKKWVDKGMGRPALELIYFSGEKAYATNTHHLAIVKNYPVKEAHYETPDGYEEKQDLPEKPLDYERPLIQENDALWKYEVNFGPLLFKDFITPWKMAIDFLAKATKKQEYKPIILQKKGKRLLAYAAPNEKWLKAKIVLIDNLEDDGRDWEMGFNSAYLLDIVDFLKATEPEKLKIFINKAATVLTVETEDLILTTTCLRILEQSGTAKTHAQEVVAFMRSEAADSQFLD
ncbi:MAG: hypothetical protein IJ849_09560 [Selenomonadaceae bacterium]|nr:hypothetical protein [Selenomonadaceae bacterium]